MLDGLAAYLGWIRDRIAQPSRFGPFRNQNYKRSLYWPTRGLPHHRPGSVHAGKIEERPDTNCITYFNRNQKGEPLKSATIVIRNHSRMAIGLLCINFYMNTSVFQFLQSMTPPAAQTPDSPVEESYVENVDELIVQAVTEASQKVQNDSAISNANKNKEIVSILYQRGIFNLKDAVVKVAGLMGISKNTVYMHVRNLNHG